MRSCRYLRRVRTHHGITAPHFPADLRCQGEAKEIRAEIELGRALPSGALLLQVLGYQRLERKTVAVLAALLNGSLPASGRPAVARGARAAAKRIGKPHPEALSLLQRLGR